MQLLHTLPLADDDYIDWMESEIVNGEEVLFIHTADDRRFIMRVVPDGTTITEVFADGRCADC